MPPTIPNPRPVIDPTAGHCGIGMINLRRGNSAKADIFCFGNTAKRTILVQNSAKYENPVVLNAAPSYWFRQLIPP
jgi:hypothetical protein